MGEGDLQDVAGGRGPPGLRRGLRQPEQPRGQISVIHRNARRLADPALQGGPAQAPVDPVGGEQVRGGLFGGPTRSGSARITPASASAPIASPFQAVTTLSSRAGCGRSARARSRAARTRFHQAGSSGRSAVAASSCRPSNVPESVTLSSAAARAPSAAPSASAKARRESRRT